MRRKAKAVDVPRMVELLRERSEHCADAGLLTFDQALARRTVFHCVTSNLAYAAVAEIDGQIEGLICGILQPYYGLAVELEATDLWWVGTDKCSGRDKVGLMHDFVAWAWTKPKVARVTCGVTKMMGKDTEAGERVLEGLGMEQFGKIYRAAIKVKEKAA
jgi:hypothetical protein